MSDYLPCPECAEAVKKAARSCRFCGLDLLVSLVTEEPADRRQGYAATRELADLAPDQFPFIETRRRLERGGTLAEGLTRELAERAVAVLSAQGIPVSVADAPRAPAPPPTTTPTSPPRRSRLPLLVVAGLAIAAWWATRDGRWRTWLAPEPASSSPTEVDLAEAALRASVRLRCDDSEGAGFFVADDLVVTNRHVLCSDREVPDIETHDGRHLTGRLLEPRSAVDLVAIRVDGEPGGSVPLPLGDAALLRPGSRVTLVGNPLGIGFSVVQGIVSHPARPVLGIAYIQLDANINPGASGGPVLDPAGHAVGVTTLTVGESTGVGLALPVNYLFSGDEPMLPAGTRPESEAERAAWEGLLEHVRSEEEEELQTVRSELDLVALIRLVDSRVTTPTGVGTLANDVTLLVEMEATFWKKSLGKSFAFQLEGARAGPCRLQVESWQVTNPAEDEQEATERYTEWLEGHGIRTRYQRGLAQLYGRCDLGGHTSLVGLGLSVQPGLPDKSSLLFVRVPLDQRR